MIWIMSPRGIMIMIPGRTGVILAFGTGIAGFSRTMRKPSCLSYLVPRCFGGKACVRPDSCSASGSVVHANPDPVVTVLSPNAPRGNEIVLHQLEEKCWINTSSVSPLNSSDPSAELGAYGY